MTRSGRVKAQCMLIPSRRPRLCETRGAFGCSPYISPNPLSLDTFDSEDGFGVQVLGRKELHCSEIITRFKIQWN